MALDRWLGPILDIARSLTGTDAPTRPSAPPPAPTPSAPPPYASATSQAPASPAAGAEVTEADVDGTASLATGTDDAEIIAAPTARAHGDADAEGAYDDPAGGEDEHEHAAPRAAEPVVSRAMAKMLLAQGHARRAVAMYEALVANKPQDEMLARELEAARERADEEPSRAEEDDDGLAGDDEIVALRASEKDVLLSWQVGDGRIARGRRILPGDSEVAVKIVVFHRAEGFAVRREERERKVERIGEWLVRDVPRDAWMTASIGLRRDGQFVSLAHSSAARAS